MKRGGFLKRKTPLPYMSAKRRGELKAYQLAKAEVFRRAEDSYGNPQCQLQAALPTVLCAGPLDPHHVYIQSRHPERRNDPDAMQVACRAHHDYVHAHPAESMESGLIR